MSKFNKTWYVKRTNFIPGLEPKTSVSCVHVFSREKGKNCVNNNSTNTKNQSLSSEFLIKLQPHKAVGVRLILRLFEACLSVSLPNEITLIRPTLLPKPTNSVSWTNKLPPPPTFCKECSHYMQNMEPKFHKTEVWLILHACKSMLWCLPGTAV